MFAKSQLSAKFIFEFRIDYLEIKFKGKNKYTINTI